MRMKKSMYSVFCGILFCVAMTDAFPSRGEVEKISSDQIGAQCSESKRQLFEKQMDDYIAQQMQESDAAGLSIVVVENNKTIYEKGFGYADKENNIPVDPSTLFHIGSITKLFTGIGIMQLVQKRLIDIDAPIQRYLPEFSIKYHIPTHRPITIRSIMAHQSGIFGDKNFNCLAESYPEDDFRNYPAFARNEYAAYHPDYITSYSNFAVSLLGLIIERVSRQKYEDYIYDNILRPCGMTQSGFDPAKDHAALLAKGYDVGGELFPYYYIAVNPAGFLASNSDNMAKFMKMILNNGRHDNKPIISPTMLQYMYQPQSRFLPMSLADGYASPYNFGLSWMLENKSFSYLGAVVGHGGNLPPYNSNLLIAKDQNVAVFVTANKANFMPNKISYFALALAAKIFRRIDKPALPEIPSSITMPDHLKRFYTGTYCVLNMNPIEIYSENDTLFFHELHSERIPLVYHADGWLSLSVNNELIPGIRLAVRRINNQKVACIEDRDEFLVHRMITGNNFDPEDTLSDEVCAMAGIYSETTSSQPALMMYPDTLSQSGKPFMTIRSLIDNIPIVVTPAENATLIIQGLGRSARETMYFSDDTLNSSGFKFTKISGLTTRGSLAPLAATKAAASTVKSSEDVINRLKKSIEKEKTF
jgi:CubicO group peptidase (beta-lactamase class C family)